MASSWRRSLGNMRSFIGNCMGGLRGGSNLASWVVAGTLAYFLWVKPSQELRREQEVPCLSHFDTILQFIGFKFLSFSFANFLVLQERAALAAASDPYRYVEKRKPIPDPQVIYSVQIHVFCSLFFLFWFNCDSYIAIWVNCFQETGLIYGNKNRTNKSQDWNFWVFSFFDVVRVGLFFNMFLWEVFE